MAKYSCRFLNDEGRIDDVEMINCGTDELAQAKASTLFARSSYPGVEVWIDERLVFKADKKAA